MLCVLDFQWAAIFIFDSLALYAMHRLVDTCFGYQ